MAKAMIRINGVTIKRGLPHGIVTIDRCEYVDFLSDDMVNVIYEQTVIILDGLATLIEKQLADRVWRVV